MKVLITLKQLGESLDNFDLLSDTDGFTIPFIKNVTRNQLLAGYIPDPILLPVGTTVIRVLSDSACTNFIDIPIELIP